MPAFIICNKFLANKRILYLTNKTKTNKAISLKLVRILYKIYYPLIRCWCHLLRLWILLSPDKATCGYQMYPQQTWRVKTLWRHNNFQQPIKSLVNFFGVDTCKTRQKISVIRVNWRYHSLLQFSISNSCANMYIETISKNSTILFVLCYGNYSPYPTYFFRRNVYLTSMVYRCTIYSLWWFMWVWRYM